MNDNIFFKEFLDKNNNEIFIFYLPGINIEDLNFISNLNSFQIKIKDPKFFEGLEDIIPNYWDDNNEITTINLNPEFYEQVPEIISFDGIFVLKFLRL